MVSSAMGAISVVALLLVRKENAILELRMRDWIRANFAAEPDTGRRLDVLDKALEHCAPLGESDRRFQQLDEGMRSLSESVARAWHQSADKGC